MKHDDDNNCCSSHKKSSSNPSQHSHGHSHTHDHEHSHSDKKESSFQYNRQLTNSQTSNFSVSGMDCADEIAAIQQSLNHPLVSGVSANLMTSEVSITHSPEMEAQDLKTLIEKAGVRVVSNTQLTRSFFQENKMRIALVSVSGLFVVLGLIANLVLKLNEPVVFTLFLLATLCGGALVFPKAWRSLKNKNFDMNVLMTIAAVGAFLIQEYSEGATVVFLFSLAEMLEAFSVSRARKAIREVLSITPKTALVKNGEQTSAVPIEQVKVGSLILVRAGDNIPLDGRVVEGESYVNQAPLTGESQPIVRKQGDLVLAGTINESGSLVVEVSHEFQDTKIAQVIRLIEEAQAQKAPSQVFVDRFSRIYTPAVTIVALLVFLVPPLIFASDWATWAYRSLVFLVIACPCALVIATPVSIVSSLTALARKGVLVKGGRFLEELGRLKALAVDKTGTITEGKPRVVSVKRFGHLSDSEFYNVVLSLESQSSHPLAKAAVEFALEKNATSLIADQYQVIAGKGVEATINNHNYFAGNHNMAHALGVCTPELENYLQELERNAQSVVIFGHRPHAQCDGEVMGVLALADSPRPQVHKAIQNLHAVGIEKISMLSGDNQRTAEAIAKSVGIDEVAGDLLPADKVAEVTSLLQRFEHVAMIGDGINDAPALAKASVGIAMGAAGTDAAIETADIALMTDDLNQLPAAIQHGRFTLSVIRFNIGFALAVKAVFLVLGAAGISNLWLAVAADMGASLLVIANSMRLLKVQDISSRLDV